jgi:hydrogenase maturation protease
MRVRILCFGNLLAGDDGFGVHVFNSLQASALRERAGLSVEIFDAGVLGMSALTLFEHCEHVIVVDALAYAGQAGRVCVLELSELSPPAAAFSAHALDLTHLFHVLPIVFEGRSTPTVTVVGAEIAAPSGDFSMLLSPPLQAAIEPALTLIREQLDALRDCAGQLEVAALRAHDRLQG